MRGKLVVGNWKMNGGLRQNDALLGDLRAAWTAPPGRQLAVCVPYPYLWQAQAALSGSAIAWGAQSVSEHAGGAFTGEVSAAMVAEFGCRYAIVGHSERRALFGEADAAVAAKAVAALAAGMTPIVCVGETLGEREAGATETVVLRQLDAVIAAVAMQLAALVVAYEPVWAIGTGRTATPEQAEAVHGAIRGAILERYGRDRADAVRIIYGGSVNDENVDSLVSKPDIDGALVGGASLKADSFARIVRARTR